MCKQSENTAESEGEPRSPSERQYLDRIAKLEKLVDIQEQQKKRLKHLNAGLIDKVKELMSR